MFQESYFRISEEQSLEEYFLQGLRTVVDQGFIRLRYVFRISNLIYYFYVFKEKFVI